MLFKTMRVFLLVISMYTHDALYRGIGLKRRMNLQMRWSYEKSSKSLKDMGLLGSEGELYFSTQKKIKLTGPPQAIGKTQKVPIFLHNNVLIPLGIDWINVFEMNHRQLFTENEVFGFSFYSQAKQKISLVGTLARIQSKKILSDGRIFAVVEGFERFYLEEVITENPYIKGRVRTYRDFNDQSLVESDIEDLERSIFLEVRINLKYLQMLSPAKKYSMSTSILKYYPPTRPAYGVRTISFTDEDEQLERVSKFSFAVLDMLEVGPAAKLAYLQEHVLQKRLAKILTLLQTGGEFMSSQLLKKALVTEDILTQIRREEETSENGVLKGIDRRLFSDELKDSSLTEDFKSQLLRPVLFNAL